MAAVQGACAESVACSALSSLLHQAVTASLKYAQLFDGFMKALCAVCCRAGPMAQLACRCRVTEKQS